MKNATEKVQLKDEFGRTEEKQSSSMSVCVQRQAEFAKWALKDLEERETSKCIKAGAFQDF